VTPRIVIKGSPAHRWWQITGYLALTAAIAGVAATQPNYRLILFAEVAAMAVAVLGLNVVTGYSGQISLGHSAFLGLGGYTAAVLVSDHSWPFLATLPVAAGFGLVVGLLVGLPALRIRGLYLALVTLALAVAFPSIARTEQVSGLTGGANGKPVTLNWRTPSWFPVDVTDRAWQFLVLCAIAAMLFLLASNAMRGRVGRSLLAVRDNETSAAVCGVHPAAWKASAFAVSAAYASVAGAMLTLVIPVVGPESGGFVVAVQLVTALVIGGAATISGAAFGALAIVWLPELTKSWGDRLPFFKQGSGPVLANAVYGVALIAVVFAMPGGVTWFVRLVRSTLVRFEPRLPTSSSPRKDEPSPLVGAAVRTTGGGAP
jgi:branched-chain amino acid transport system permease protein